MLSTLTLFSELLAGPSCVRGASVFNIEWEYLIILGPLPNHRPQTECFIAHRPIALRARVA